MSSRKYKNPLCERYASDAMLYIFSDEYRFTTWRSLWVALAKAQKKQNINITEEQIEALSATLSEINFEKVASYEKEYRHDVMAHIHAYGDVAPKAKPIIHLGATSAFVVDNTDIIQARKALLLIQQHLINILYHLQSFIEKHKALPTLAYTHFQAAQPTSVGKRAATWAHSLVTDMEEMEFLISKLKLRGAQGTTGTGASYKQLLEDDFEKFQQLNQDIAASFGFNATYDVCGQTYDRKIDSRVLNVLSQIAQSAHKITNDIRLLSHLKHMDEPFGDKQVGSSAMAYKRNPMKSERVSSLCKFVTALAQSTVAVASTQWLERSLDDSANKRLAIPQAFLAVDAILILLQDILEGIQIYPKVIMKHLKEELPFMITEHLIMEGVKLGGDRQQLHECIRKHSVEAGKQVKIEGEKNDLLERLADEPEMPFNLEQLKNLCEPSLHIGFAKKQCEEYSENYLQPLLEKHKKWIGLKDEVRV